MFEFDFVSTSTKQFHPGYDYSIAGVTNVVLVGTRSPARTM